MRRQSFILCVLATVAGAVANGGQGRGGTPVGANGECPAGMTLVRPGNCQAPLTPPPSIVDYRPKSTLVAPEHKVPKAKYPAIDFHGHPGSRISSPEALKTLFGELDALNIGLMLAAENISGERLKTALATVKASPYARRVSIFTGVSLSGVGPGWAEKAIAQLEADVAAGAVGVGEIGKGFGLSPQGRRHPLADGRSGTGADSGTHARA